MFFQKTNTVGFDHNMSLDASSVRIEHSSPVLKGVRNQTVSWNRSGGIIKISNFYGSQIDFYHITIGSISIHCDPVANSYHVVYGYLNTGHKSQKSISKNQDNHCRNCSQNSQQLFLVYIKQF